MIESEPLTQQKLQEVLIDAYAMGTGNESIKVLELIEEIKQQILEVKGYANINSWGGR